MRELNIFSQPMEHMDAKIVGNREGLEALKDAIDNALNHQKHGIYHLGAVGEPLWASDGEGYCLEIKHREKFGETFEDEDCIFYHRVIDRD